MDEACKKKNGPWNRAVSAGRRRASENARPYQNKKRKEKERKKKRNIINQRFNSSCLVYEPWFSYISYVFHGTIKARGNPQRLQLLLNITRFGPRGRVLGLRRLLEKGERGRGGGAVGVEERRKERRRKLEVKAKCLNCNRTQLYL